MTHHEALEIVKLAARDFDRAAKRGMDFHVANPRTLDEACRTVVSMSRAPLYAKQFAYMRLGGSYDLGYLPS